MNKFVNWLFGRNDDYFGTLEVYQDAANKWRWRLKNDKGAIVATGHQGHKGYKAAARDWRQVTDMCHVGKIQIVRKFKNK